MNIEEGDFGEYISGRATVERNGNTEVVLSAAGFCENITMDQTLNQGVVFLGGIIEIDSDGEVYLEDDETMDVVFTKENDNFEEGTEYEAYYVQDTQALEDLSIANNGLSQEIIIQLGTLVKVTYSSIGTDFIKGSITTTDERVLANFNASAFICG